MKKDMNFFSQFAGKRKGQSSSDLYVYLIGGIVLVGIIVISLYYLIAMFFTNKSITDYETKLNNPEVQEKLAESDKVNIKIDALTRYDKELNIIIQGINSRDAVTSDLIVKLFKECPKEIKVGNFKIDSKEITMGAESTSKVAIAEFENYLSKLDMVQSVHISSIKGEDKFTFDVKCILKDVE